MRSAKIRNGTLLLRAAFRDLLRLAVGDAYRTIGHRNHCTGVKSLFDVRPHGFEQCRERAGVETFPAHTHYGGAGFGAAR